ncbi:autophagy-related protein [Lentinula edodes]|uniref:Autophagy-related protein 101 n=1 Tax=Lentinula lateritia TaxID=40482 RepID=A0A9W9DUQ2_9AGAR|nr:autophagy-related protein [Lentinula edodes]KAH7880896.1 autophagy-related protein [Lentinula edodes]KAJ3872477.1 autophagy-related protein [Lentinula edodes]KAJ3895552.1 autophagy-related protein [Lentinula edodes]KAJ4484966.1 autophagy-related protein [Lentinula edodes]
MNTYPTITIDLILDRVTIKDVLHAILDAILFHRLFGTVKPTTREVFGVTMPGVSDAEMGQLVEEKVELFWKGIEEGMSKRGQIIITFSEKRPKKSWFQVYVGEEDVPWEQWIINAEIQQPRDRDRQKFDAALSNTLTKAIHTMLTHTSSDRGRTAVPLITNATGISPFPIRIAVKVGGVEIG